MGLYRTVLLLLGSIFLMNSVQCKEFVPVYMWSSIRSSEKIPALRKISQESFKDDILEHLKYYDFIVTFAEHTLSPEDFIQKDETGNSVFTQLSKYRESAKTNYYPFVENPLTSIKGLGVSISEIYIKDEFEVPKTDILIVNLNDAEDSENRIHMLKRHDEKINSMYQKIVKEDKNVLILYTAYHESWIDSEDLTNTRRARSLLQSEPVNEVQGTFYNDSVVLLYYTEATYKESTKNTTNVSFDITSTKDVNTTTVTLNSTAAQLHINLLFSDTSSVGYWQLEEVNAMLAGVEYILSSSANLYAPYMFSYHCGDQVFSNRNMTVKIKDFQIQLYKSSPPATNQFDDPYDCVGFTTVPIWSGLFVTIILLLILTFGITMMMDIRTMDRFDDPKGKTITISAE